MLCLPDAHDTIEPMSLSPHDRQSLEYACGILSSPSLAIRLANYVGMPLERLLNRLPEPWTKAVHRAASTAIERALEVAVNSLGPANGRAPTDFFHKLVCGVSGGVGGFFGVAALPVELPISTGIMLRSIAEIARSQGEDIGLAEARMACLEVFAFGGLSSRDDAAEAGYYAVRAALATAIREAAEYIAERGLAGGGGPVLARLVGQIASRFGVAVSEKAAAEAVPIIGAAGGAAINVVFIEHFQNMARAHFTIRRLERAYGAEIVREEFHRLCPEQGA